MTSATIFNPNNCAHEQLFKASGLVEANIATTVTKDNICASGKEGIKGNDQTDNRTSLCKPEDLFLALAHIENKLARAWLHKFDEGKKILIDPIATLSEHHVSDNDKGYATLDCFIFMDSFGAQNLATNGTQIPYCNAAQDDDWSHNQPVDGDEKVFMCLVDYDLADGQLAHAAGGTPSKPHEWMVSNLLSPYSSTLAMHAQSDSGGCGKLIVSGFINAEDNKATEHSRPAHQQLPLIGRQRRQTRSGASMARGQRFSSPAVQSAPWSYESSGNDVQVMLMQEKTEQTAPASSPGLVHHPKMGAESYTLLSVFESPTDSNSGPAGPIAVNAPAAKIRGFGTSSKDISTADYSRGRMSPSAAGVAGKPRTQRPGKSADEATKDKGKDNMSGPTPSYQPVRQELPCDSDSEGVRAVISAVNYPQPRTDHRTMNAHFCNVTQYGDWSSAQSANGDGVVSYPNLAFTCFAEDTLVGSQLSLGTPASLPCDQVVGNPLSLYSSYLAPPAQHAPSAHDKTIIPALKNIQDDKPKEKEEQPLPSLFDSGILQPFEVGAGNELEPKTSPPMTRTTRRTSRLAAYVIPEVHEPPSDDVLGPEGSSPGSAAVNTPAVRSKRAGSTGTPKTAKLRRVRESTSAATLAGEPRTQWDVSEDHSPPAAVPRPTPKSTN